MSNRPTRKQFEQSKADIAHLWRGGASVDALAHKTGLTRKQVKRHLNQAGIFLNANRDGISGEPIAHATDASSPKFHRDAELVLRLIQCGGYARLSEKPTRTGPVVCLPLIPFEGIAA